MVWFLRRRRWFTIVKAKTWPCSDSDLELSMHKCDDVFLSPSASERWEYSKKWTNTVVVNQWGFPVNMFIHTHRLKNLYNNVVSDKSITSAIHFPLAFMNTKPLWSYQTSHMHRHRHRHSDSLRVSVPCYMPNGFLLIDLLLGPPPHGLPPPLFSSVASLWLVSGSEGCAN